MRLLVLSDTHSLPLPQQLQEELKLADKVIHVGDFCEAVDLSRLKEQKEVLAVYGNMDSLELRKILPRQTVVHVEDVAIGLVHGEGAPHGLLERVRGMFKGEKLDAIVYGHSHHSKNEVVEGVLFFNPGSPTDKVRPPYCSFGVLEVNGKAIKGKIVKIK